MGREGHQVHLHALQIDRHLAGALGRIHVEQDLARPGQLTDGGDILDDADLVVDVHQRHENGVVAQGRLELGEIDQSVRLGVQVGDLEALALELAAGVEHGLVLGFAGDDVAATLVVEVGRALDRQVVGLRRAGGPDDLLGIGIDQLGHGPARVVDGLLRLPAEGMGTRRRVTETAVHGQAGTHGLGHPRIDRGGCRIVHVDG